MCYGSHIKELSSVSLSSSTSSFHQDPRVVDDGLGPRLRVLREALRSGTETRGTTSTRKSRFVDLRGPRVGLSVGVWVSILEGKHSGQMSERKKVLNKKRVRHSHAIFCWRAFLTKIDQTTGRRTTPWLSDELLVMMKKIWTKKIPIGIEEEVEGEGASGFYETVVVSLDWGAGLFYSRSFSCFCDNVWVFFLYVNFVDCRNTLFCTFYFSKGKYNTQGRLKGNLHVL